MNPYDDAVKALCAADLTGLCRWLGVDVEGPAEPVRLGESAPSTATRAVDLLMAANPDTLVHVEFQTRPEARFPQRMLDYLLRLDAAPERAGRRIEQHVVVLGPKRLPGGLVMPRLSYSYGMHHLADEDPEPFLAEPALTPFAVLARMPDHERPTMLARVLDLLAAWPDALRQEIIGRAVATLACIRLPPATIDLIWKESAMPIPNVIHERYLEGRTEGLAAAAASLLRIRFGDDERIERLSGRLAQLGAAECMARIEGAKSLGELA